MKRSLLITLLSFFIIPLHAQNKARLFEVNGLKVIFRPTQKETLSMSMYYRGGVMNYAPEQAGIEYLALAAASSCGTKNYSAHDYHELADEYGIEIKGDAEKDYGTISMNCTDKYFDQGWKLFADAVVNPIFDPVDFQKLKAKAISSIHAKESDPEERMEQLSAAAMFYGTPYATDPMGTVESIGRQTADSTSIYYHNKLLNKKNMFLVVAGRITKEELEKKITASFAAIRENPYTPITYNQTELKGEKILTESRSLATNYMNCILNAPTLTSPDYYAFLLGVDALSGSLHYELRTKQGLSYSAGATIQMQQIPYTSIFVSTTQPAKAHTGITTVYRSLRINGINNPDFLEVIKKSHRSSYYRHQESSTAIVRDLGRAEVFGDYKLEEYKIVSINRVTLQQINAALSKYLKGAIWIYLGDEEVAQSIFKVAKKDSE
ncbi:putative Zn-dependent peptidase [Pedobacter cryoconitis]|uniref:M16 family metallopeptidase n=1 Tax=Pedobacter cryoconitis TaxID=188932 RepID=UPI0016142DF4|nr:pitrilysin family protein [Pedobacter cryoconitis]MBB6273377.1 putative Zn-dependent peptidase [Pedobacter cryoconitis]